MNKPVIVGFDAGEHSAEAVERAAVEAAVRRVPLRLVHVFDWIPPMLVPGFPFDAVTKDDVRKAGVACLDEAAQKVRDGHPGLVVEAVALDGDPARKLAETARDASLLVVGGRGAGGFSGLLLGSVALRVLTRAACPVMVVRGSQAANVGRVTVGVDLLSVKTSADALDLAFAEARRRDAGLTALTVWEDPYRSLGILGQLSPDSLAAFGDLQRELLAVAVEPLRKKYPDVAVTQQALPGVMSRLLVDATEQCDVLVIGGDAREKRPGMRVGALAHIVLHHAQCPVILVPEH